MFSLHLIGELKPRPHRFWSLDILRGICALTVFTNHWVLWSNFAPAGPFESWLHQYLATAYGIFVTLAWPTGGQHPALVGFFVLSGFCVHYPFESRVGQAGPPIAWRDYFARRVRRIMPVYWVGSLLGLLLVGMMHWRPVADPLLILHTAVTPGQVAARFGAYSAIWPDEVFVGNYILNTVGVEILIYAFYPVFFKQAAADRWWQLGVLVVSMQILALFLQPYFDPYVLFASVLVMGMFWYLGALVAHLHQKTNWMVRGWWIAVAWAVFLALKIIPPFYGRNTLKQAVWGVVCMLLVGWLLGWEKRNESLRNRVWIRLFRWFGDISYSLYAVHTPTILLVNWALLSFAETHSYGWQLALNLLLSFAITLLVNRFVEVRFYRPPQSAGKVPPS